MLYFIVEFIYTSITCANVERKEKNAFRVSGRCVSQL